jgi:hypothetical protein
MRTSDTRNMATGFDILPSELMELNLVTLNCWGLPYISSHRAARLSAIGRSLASLTFASNNEPAHIVALQELWTQEDYEVIRRETRYVLPYSKRYFSGAFLGSGLAILSRWPIEESTMLPFSLNGRPTAVFRGDWYVGKGIGCARIRYGQGPKQVIEVFNTHVSPGVTTCDPRARIGLIDGSSSTPSMSNTPKPTPTTSTGCPKLGHCPSWSRGLRNADT